mmetsp:Transcript_105724/g.297351  ORF Transcript_105724/g.297351 Transcript_105724/m.297351 type:complete len:233 (-) Transcript_105724:56-754(-)
MARGHTKVTHVALLHFQHDFHAVEALLKKKAGVPVEFELREKRLDSHRLLGLLQHGRLQIGRRSRRFRSWLMKASAGQVADRVRNFLRRRRCGSAVATARTSAVLAGCCAKRVGRRCFPLPYTAFSGFRWCVQNLFHVALGERLVVCARTPPRPTNVAPVPVRLAGFNHAAQSLHLGLHFFGFFLHTPRVILADSYAPQSRHCAKRAAYFPPRVAPQPEPRRPRRCTTDQTP